MQEVTDKDFDVFYRIDAPSTSQTHTSAEMGFEEKTSNLLALLTTHARGSFPSVAVVPWPPTSIATNTSSTDARKRKRKRA